MKTRYLKVIRDLKYDLARNLMLVLAMAIGVCSVGAILGAYSVISHAMTANYMSTSPASATLDLEDSISTALLDSVWQFDGISAADRHATVVARMKVNDRWHPLLLFVIDDFLAKSTNKIRPVSGDPVPSYATMLTERTAYVVMQAHEGDSITIKTPNSTPKQIKLSGTVHDAGLAPAWQEQSGYGYISLSTLQWLGEPHQFHQLRILVSQQKDSREHITKKATELADWLKLHGHEVHGIQVPPPGKHPHQSQMNAVMTIMIVCCYVVLLLSAILVGTSVSTLMIKQIRQIGIMKTIGGRQWQLMRMYGWMLLIICVVALLVAIPVSRLAATAFYKQLAALLNLELTGERMPLYVPILQILSGILIPFAAIALPVIRGTRIPVKKALDNHGVTNPGITDQSWLLRWSRVFTGSETLLLAIRNTFRQRTRFIMTLCLLAAGGAVFMTALNVSDAWDKNLQKIYVQKLYDVDIRLQEPLIATNAITNIKQFGGVRDVEGWFGVSASVIQNGKYDISRTYPDKGHGSFTLQGLPIPTNLLRPEVTAGQWLHYTDSAEIVLNQQAVGFIKNVRIGDRINLQVNGKPTQWRVAGFTNDFGTPATAYVSLDALRQQVPTAGSFTALKVGYHDRSVPNARRITSEIEKLLEQEQVPVNLSIPVWMLRNAVAGHMKVMINALLSIALLMGLVGILGLAAAISVSVLERRREIGVMRAIGATPAAIMKIIVGEGFIIGVISIALAFAVSLLLSFYFGRFIGSISFRTPLLLTVSGVGVVIWTSIIIIGSFVASVVPAKRAISSTTRESLSYE